MDSSSKEDVGAKVQGVCDTQRGLRMQRLPREPESRRERQWTPFAAWRRQSAAHGGERPNLCHVANKAIRQGSHNRSAGGLREYLNVLKICLKLLGGSAAGCLMLNFKHYSLCSHHTVMSTQVVAPVTHDPAQQR